MALPEIELIKIPAADSEYTDNKDIGGKSVIWVDNGNRKATIWDASFGAWNLLSKVYVLGEEGYHLDKLALFVGIDKNNLACYVIYDPDF
jgi:hypothetical protein